MPDLAAAIDIVLAAHLEPAEHLAIARQLLELAVDRRAAADYPLAMTELGVRSGERPRVIGAWASWMRRSRRSP